MQGEITALNADRKGRPRVHVFLDGAWALSLSTAVAAGLQVGQRLAPEEVQALQQQESLQAAIHQALRLISRNALASGFSGDELTDEQEADSVLGGPDGGRR